MLAGLGRDCDLFIIEATDRDGEIQRPVRNLMTPAEAGRWGRQAGARRLNGYPLLARKRPRGLDGGRFRRVRRGRTDSRRRPYRPVRTLKITMCSWNLNQAPRGHVGTGSLVRLLLTQIAPLFRDPPRYQPSFRSALLQHLETLATGGSGDPGRQGSWIAEVFKLVCQVQPHVLRNVLGVGGR